MTEQRLTEAPEGWIKTQGASNPPGYEWYSNGESRFSGKRKIALVKIKEEEMIYPNCSEIVWKLKGIGPVEGMSEIHADTSSGETGFEDMVEFLKLAKQRKKDLDKVELVYVDNLGGGGNWDYVVHAFVVAKKLVKGVIKEEDAQRMVEEYEG